jgi:hypothetical protein
MPSDLLQSVIVFAVAIGAMLAARFLVRAMARKPPAEAPRIPPAVPPARATAARHFGLGLDDARPHLLLRGDGHRAALLRFRLRDLFVRIRLGNLQLRADVLADIYIRDVDGEDLVRRSGIESFRQHMLGNVIGVLEHVLVRLRAGMSSADCSSWST